MPVRLLWAFCFVCTIVDGLALGAHALELPNKLAMPGPLWLGVQQNLYRGWGPVLGPFEVGAVLGTALLAFLLRGRPRIGPSTAAAAGLLGLTLVLFFVLVQPVNRAFAGWTPETLPADWERWRLQWEIGHATRLVLAGTALALLARAALLDWSLRIRPDGAAAPRSSKAGARHGSTIAPRTPT